MYGTRVPGGYVFIAQEIPRLSSTLPGLQTEKPKEFVTHEIPSSGSWSLSANNKLSNRVRVRVIHLLIGITTEFQSLFILAQFKIFIQYH
jgi:hypothetical protein